MLLSTSALIVPKILGTFRLCSEIIVPNDRNAQAGNAQAHEGRIAVHRLHALVADISVLAKNDVSLGDFGSFMVVAASVPGQKMTFKLQGTFPSEMFPASAGQASVNCLPVNRKLWICDVKFSLNAVCTTCDWCQL